MKELERYVEKYWWVAFVMLALIVLKDTSVLLFAGAVALVIWVRSIKIKKNVGFLLDSNDCNTVNYKGKWYTRDTAGNIYKVKPGK